MKGYENPLQRSENLLFLTKYDEVKHNYHPKNLTGSLASCSLHCAPPRTHLNGTPVPVAPFLQRTFCLLVDDFCSNKVNNKSLVETHTFNGLTTCAERCDSEKIVRIAYNKFASWPTLHFIKCPVENHKQGFEGIKIEVNITYDRLLSSC